MSHFSFLATKTDGALIAEAIIVAGGGVVASDDGRDVEEERPEVVNASAHSLAVRPPAGATATAGQVVGDVRSTDDHGAGRDDINAAARAVPTIAPAGAIAANGQVVADGGIRDGCSAA